MSPWGATLTPWIPSSSSSSSRASPPRSAGSPRSSRTTTSWVDRIWSIVPVIYVWIFAVAALAGGSRRDATGRDGRAGHRLGRAAHLQLRPQGRLHRHGGLPLGGPARAHEAVAVPGVQPALHRRLPERAARAHLAARVHRVAASGAVQRMGCRVRGRSSPRSSSARPSPTSSSGPSTRRRRRPAARWSPGS